MIISDFSLEVVRYVQQMRGPLLDPFFKGLNFFDSVPFFALLIVLTWVIYGSKIGSRFFYCTFASMVVSTLLKEWIGSPRPFHLDPSLMVLFTKGNGFPSGAAQGAVLLSALLFYVWKHWMRWVVAFLYVGLISFSRIYLGVHFLEDVIGGWVIGLLIGFGFVKIYPKLDEIIAKTSPWKMFVLVELLFMILALVSVRAMMFQLSLVGMGVALIRYKNNRSLIHSS